MLTIIYGGQVDGFRPYGAQSGRHFQPQFVAVHPQRLDGAGFLTGLDLWASRPQLPHLFTRFFLLLHHVTWQVSPPAIKKKNVVMLFLCHLFFFSLRLHESCSVCWMFKEK